MIKKRNYLLTTVLMYCSAFAFMIATNPNNLPLLLLTIPFLLLFIAFYRSAKLLLDKFCANLHAKTQQLAALILAGLPILLIILQSIGQLSFKDLFIVFGLMAGLVFYLRKADFL